jgi:UDP-2,3-diacylglucosamine pyrophosphatase LpxH
MKFLQKDEIKKTIIIISDLHLSAGNLVNGRKNFLEDFHYDKELIEFLQYHSNGYFLDRDIELIINGDFFDLLAVPYVKYFDDEFWSEEASLEKLKIIVKAHIDVIEALVEFLSYPNNKITYILGNHDSEIILPKLQEYLLQIFPIESRERFSLLINDNIVYIPEEGIVVKHGHEYELAHHFSSNSVATDKDGVRYFIPPWGSYYVARVINKFKEGRDYINSVRPINKFIINGLIYDTLFTIRFGFSNIIYYLMVRVLLIFKQNRKLKEIIAGVKIEMELFKNYETLTEEEITENPAIHALIVGHTHDPIFREYDDGSIFINTGTWTKMYNLDFGKSFHGAKLTYARIDIKEKDLSLNKDFEHLSINLNEWKGRNDLPFKEFHY